MESDHDLNDQLRRGLLLLACAVGVAACGTTLTASKFDHENSVRKTALAGVPFTINRPVPTVTRTAGADGKDDTYVIRIDYVPDPNGRYVLQIDPSTLSSVDFEMSFDANGSLTETSAKTTDQTATIIASAAKFGLAGMLDSAGETEADVLAQWDRDMTALLADPRTLVVDAGGRTRAVTQRDRAAWRELHGRLATLAQEKALRKQYVYRDRDEFALLMTLAQSYRTSADPTVDPLQQAVYKKAEQKAAGDSSGPVTVPAVGRYVQERNRAALEALRSRVVAQRTTLRAALEQDASADNKNALAANYAFLSYVLAAQQAYSAKELLLLDIVDMTPGEWQRRRLVQLNRAIDARRHLVQVGAAEGDAAAHADTDAKLIALNREKAAVLGVGREYERSVKLHQLLLTTAQSKDMKALREEIGLVDLTILNAELALKPKAADAAKADDGVSGAYLVFEPAQQVDSETVKAQLGSKRPKYVVAVQAVLVAAPASQPGTPAQPPAGGPTPSTPPSPPLDGGPLPPVPVTPGAGMPGAGMPTATR